MATIKTINDSDLISGSRTDINANFASLNSDKIETSYLDTDTALTANSDTKIATQKAVKTYVDAVGAVTPASTTTKGSVEIATDAEVIAGTDTGDTGAKLVATPGQIKTNYEKIVPITLKYEVVESTRYGDNTSRFDITNPSGTTWRYTWDGTGTNPGITAVAFPTGQYVYVTGFTDARNNGAFPIIGSGDNYFEVYHAASATQTDKTSVYVYVFTCQYTWTKPTGLKYIEVEVCGASGGTSYASASRWSGASGGGGYAKKKYLVSDLSATETINVGVKGVYSNILLSSNPSASTFKSMSGGASPNVSGSTTPTGVGGVGGTATGGDININGQSGQNSVTTIAGTGGNSMFGFGGVNLLVTDSVVGTGYGAGSSGVQGENDGASGLNGIVIVKEFY